LLTARELDADTTRVFAFPARHRALLPLDRVDQGQAGLRQLCPREITPRAVSRALTTIAKRRCSGAAKTARDCLSGMFTRHHRWRRDDQLGSGLQRSAELQRQEGLPALTGEQTGRLVEMSRSSPRAAELDLVGLVD
jgi:hypothetical protein